MYRIRSATLVLTIALAWGVPSTAQQAIGTPKGWMFGVSGGVALMDGGYFDGIEPRAEIWVHGTTYHPRKLGPDFSAFVVPMPVINSDIAVGGDLGLSYQFGGAQFALAGGGAALIPVSDDFLPGGYLAFTWMPHRVGTRFAFFTHLRQHLYVRQGEVLLYPSLNLGLTTVPRP